MGGLLYKCYICVYICIYVYFIEIQLTLPLGVQHNDSVYVYIVK